MAKGRPFVLQAEPGAGKTTRIPVALLEAGVAADGEIVVAQPRRLAARMAAARVAATLGEPVGRTVGYQVRFERKVSAQTRIRFVTEGVLARWMRDDPRLPGVAMVILDEFHERHIDADVCLALCKRTGTRVAVMSATLSPEPVATYLGGEALRCAGRTFPVEVEYAPKLSVAKAVHGLRGVDGSILVFLPGAREIREAEAACAGLGFPIFTLHGELSAEEQDRAVAPGRKLILSTNVAETSITIEGVAAVIDTGLARRPSHDPWTGIPTLTVAKIAKASAEQRAGRAGRTRAGRCLRLYSEHDYARRPDHDEPELHRLDLSGALLDLRAAGIEEPASLDWLDPPPAAAVEAAETLLRRLGAVDGGLTETGRAMLRYPAHPRLARLLVEADALGVADLGAAAAAVLSDRPRRREEARVVAAADVLVDLETLTHHQKKIRRQLATGSPDRSLSREAREAGLCRALLTAFPDRVGRLKGETIVFAAGGSATLAEESVVRDAELVVAVQIEKRERTLVRSAAQVEADWILELYTDEVEETRCVVFDPKTQRVETYEALTFGALVLDRTVRRELDDETSRVLAEAALAAGADRFVDDPAALADLRHRTAFAHTHDPSIDPVDQDRIDATLTALCNGARSFADLRKADLLAHLRAALPPELERLAPAHVTLAGGRRLRVHYEPDRPPWVQTRLQDFFGSTTGPTVANGRVQLVLHLLAPNQRAVQVTTDLAGFWSRHYPDLRRTLMRRYPKHAWPEDPLAARAPTPGHRRR